MASEQPTRTAESTDELCAPEGLTSAEQRDYWRELAQELYVALRHATLCIEIVGDELLKTGMPSDLVETVLSGCRLNYMKSIVGKAQGRS